jgi:hypothetical protein
MKNKTRLRWGVILILAALVIMLEKYYVYGVFFQADDIHILHHEYWETILIVTGIMFLFAKKIAGR